MTEPVPVIRRQARRRAIGGFIVSVILVAFGVALVPLGATDGALASFGVVTVVLGLLALLFSGIAVTVARSFPDVAPASGVNALFGILLIAVVAVGVVCTLAFGSQLLVTVAFALFTVLLGAVCGVLWNANRRDIAAARAAPGD